MGALSKLLDVVLFRDPTHEVALRRTDAWDGFEAKAATGDPLLVSSSYAGGWSRTALGDTGEIARDAHLKAGTVFACLSLLADAVAESPLRVYRYSKNQAEEQSQHELQAILNEPNPGQSGEEFIGSLVLVSALFGWCPIEKVRNRLGRVVELYPRTPNVLKRRRSAATGDVVWEMRRPGEGVHTLPDEDVVVVSWQTDPLLQKFGISPLHVLAREVGIESSLTEFLLAFLSNGGIPPFVLVRKEPIYDKALVEQIQESWGQKHGGPKAFSGPIPVIHGGLEPHVLGGDLDSMAWPDLRGVTELRICQAFRVPPHLVFARDAVTNGGLSTTEMRESMTMLQNYGATALRDRIDGALTRGLLREWEPDRSWFLDFDTSEVLSLQEDQNKRSDRARADWDSATITLNEFRQATGKETLPPEQGDVHKVLFNVTFLPSAELAGTNANAPLFAPVVREGETVAETEAAVTNAGDTSDLATRVALTRAAKSRPARRRYLDVKALSPAALEVRASAGKNTDRDRNALVQILDRKLRKFWKEQGERIVGAVASKSSADLRTKDDAAELLSLIDWDPEQALLEELLQRFYDEAGAKAFANTAAAIGVEIDWTTTNPNISKLLDDLGLRIVGIDETTRADVATIITNGGTQGLTIDQMTEQLTGLFEETYKGRAEAVALTESQVSYNLASALSYDEAGVEEAELLDNPDHVTDPGSDGLTCAERNHLLVPVADIEKHVRAEHPRGSLAVLPVVTLGE